MSGRLGSKEEAVRAETPPPRTRGKTAACHIPQPWQALVACTPQAVRSCAEESPGEREREPELLAPEFALPGGLGTARVSLSALCKSTLPRIGLSYSPQISRNPLSPREAANLGCQ